MRKRSTSIPVNPMTDEFGEGVAIEKISFDGLQLAEPEGGKQTHRHDGHSFFPLEQRTVSLEIDFKKYTTKPSSVIYIHPDQVHRTIASKNITVSSWSLNNENLNPGYLKLLEDITPAKPLLLKKETFSIISEAVTVCIRFYKRKSDKLYHSLLRDGCNTLVALVISQYLERSKSAEKIF